MRDFSHIEHWIFDLDNTLYPADCNLFEQIDIRMGAFISEFLDVDRVEARRIQKHYFIEHGTTLSGLMENHGLKPKIFLDYVHDIDHSPVQADAALDKALDNLPGEKLVFTNGTNAHAESVLKRLGVTHHFGDIHDIEASKYAPKPKRDSYELLITRTGCNPKNSAMFEDIARNLEVPDDMGMTTVLVRSKSFHPDSGLGILGSGDEPYVHHVTNHLAGFLADLANAVGSQPKVAD